MSDKCSKNIEIPHVKYGVHVTGSDDIHGPFENEYMALKEANAINKLSVKENMDRDDVIFLVATVHTWKSLTNKEG
jgi:hypothetical protein